VLITKYCTSRLRALTVVIKTSQYVSDVLYRGRWVRDFEFVTVPTVTGERRRPNGRFSVTLLFGRSLPTLFEKDLLASLFLRSDVTNDLPDTLQEAQITPMGTEECDLLMQGVVGVRIWDNHLCVYDSTNNVGSCNVRFY